MVGVELQLEAHLYWTDGNWKAGLQVAVHLALAVGCRGAERSLGAFATVAAVALHPQLRPLSPTKQMMTSHQFLTLRALYDWSLL